MCTVYDHVYLKKNSDLIIRSIYFDYNFISRYQNTLVLTGKLFAVLS